MVVGWSVGRLVGGRLVGGFKETRNTALTASINRHYQYGKYMGCKTGSNQQHYDLKYSKTCRREEVAKAEQQVPQKLDDVSSKNVVHSNFAAGNMKHFYEN